MSFIGSAKAWGDEAVARLCEIIVAANDGMAQQVMENRHDLLDIMKKEELEQVSDLDLSLPYLAVYHDRPDMVRYLHQRGLNMNKPCDSMGYGTPMFYAISMSRHNVALTLYALGVPIGAPCETCFHMPPLFYAKRKDDSFLIDWINEIYAREAKAVEFFKKNVLRNREVRRLERKKIALVHIQRITRGRLARRLVNALRAGDTLFLSHFLKAASKAPVVPLSDADDSTLQDDQSTIYTK